MPPASERNQQLVDRAWLLRWRNPTLSKATAQRAYDCEKLAFGGGAATIIGQAARVTGWHDRWVGNFAAAERSFLEAETLLQHDDFKSHRIQAMAGRAVVLYSTGRQDSASELIRRALRLLGPSGSVSTRVDLFLVQATILSYSGAFEDALALVADATDAARESGSRAELAQAVHIMARILLRMKDTAAARKPAMEAVRIAKAARSATILPYAIEVLAAVELERGRFQRAKWLASTAATLGEAQNDRRVTCQALVVLGKALNGAGNPVAALDVQKRGLSIATEISYPLWQRWFQLEIANIMEAREDFRAALPAYKAYIALDQDLFRKETEARMAEMRTKFDLQRAQELAEVERARAVELAKAREIAETAARTDQLTGLANRTGLEHYIGANPDDMALAPFAYVVIDVNRFKMVNDTLGHAAGDTLLMAIAGRLRDVMRSNDFVVRTGGDEFALIVQGVATEADAAALGQRVLDAFEKPVYFGQAVIEISASVGIATSAVIGNDLEQLMGMADKVMYAAKGRHEAAFRVYSADSAVGLLTTDPRGALRTAIANGEIQPWFQPQINLRTGALVGFEALARWVKPDGDVLLPGAFIPEIERHRLGRDFTFAILRQTLAQMVIWKKHGLVAPRVAVNVIEEVIASRAGRHAVDDILTEHPDLRGLITFEITEDISFAHGGAEIGKTMQCLGAKGSRFAMDDFGTGFGSFTHLHELKMDEVKIDMAFVHAIGVDRAAEVIIEGLIMIAKGLNLAIIAEGIETQDQAAFLLARGCEIGQGFLFSPAISPGKALASLMAARAGHASFG